MYYLESKDLALSKKRKIHLLINAVCDMRDKEILDLISDANVYSFKLFNEKLDSILDHYRILGNGFIKSYYPDAETRNYKDIFPDDEDDD